MTCKLWHRRNIGRPFCALFFLHNGVWYGRDSGRTIFWCRNADHDMRSMRNVFDSCEDCYRKIMCILAAKALCEK